MILQAVQYRIEAVYLNAQTLHTVETACIPFINPKISE